DCVDALTDVAWHLDEPVSTSSAIPLYLLAGLARRDVKVALAGQGADELFAGYTRYIAERYHQAWADVPEPARRLIGKAVVALPRTEALKRGVRALATPDTAERFRQVYAVFSDDLRTSLLRAPPDEGAVAPVDYWLAGTQHKDSLARMQAVDVRMSLADDLLHYG